MKKHPNFKMPFYTIVTWLGVQHFVRTNVGIIQRNKNVTHSQYLVFYIYKTSVLESSSCPPETFPATPEPLHDTEPESEKVCCYNSYGKPIVLNSKCMPPNLVTNVKVAMVFAVTPKVLKK
jgi:hypothetical protein